MIGAAYSTIRSNLHPQESVLDWPLQHPSIIEGVIPVLMRVTLIERQTWLTLYWGSQTKEMNILNIAWTKDTNTIDDEGM